MTRAVWWALQIVVLGAFVAATSFLCWFFRVTSPRREWLHYYDDSDLV